MNNKQLNRISKYAYTETFLDATIEQQGANQAKFMEQLSKSKHYLKTQSIVMEVFVAIYSAALVIFPAQAFDKMRHILGTGIPSNWILFAGGLTISLFIFIQIGYMMMFGMLQASSLISGDSFKWLATLPISEKELEKIVMYTFFRGVRTQLIVMALAFPIGVAITSGNIYVVLLSVLISVINVFFCFSTLVIIGEKVNRVLRNNDINTAKTTLIRITTLLGLGLGTLFIVVLFQFAIQWVDTLFTQPLSNPQLIDGMNLLFSIIPFPFGGNYLLAMLMIPTREIPPMLWITGIVGLGLYALITKKFVGRALKTLHGIIYFEAKKVSSETKEGTRKPVEIKALSPIRAYMKKDLSMATRDYQMMMFLIMPLILPLFGVFILKFAVPAEPNMMLDELLYSYYIIGIVYQMLGALMLIFGFLSVETTGASISASLPIVIRDQALGKYCFVLIISPIAAILPIIAIFDVNFLGPIMAMLVTTIFLGPIFALIAMELKVAFFGKIKDKYVLEEFNLSNRIIKWIVIIAIEIGLAVLVIVSSIMLILKDIVIFTTIYLCCEIAILIILSLIFNKMFPKPKPYLN